MQINFLLNFPSFKCLHGLELLSESNESKNESVSMKDFFRACVYSNFTAIHGRNVHVSQCSTLHTCLNLRVI